MSGVGSLVKGEACLVCSSPTHRDPMNSPTKLAIDLCFVPKTLSVLLPRKPQAGVLEHSSQSANAQALLLSPRCQYRIAVDSTGLALTTEHLQNRAIDKAAHPSLNHDSS